VRLRKVLPLLALALVSTGCTVLDRANVLSREPVYRKVRVTDLHGVLIADWVAEGRVWSYGKAFRFNAVERRTGGPYPVLSKYPQGRKVIVDGPNIVVFPTGKPLWLYEIESVSRTRVESGLEK
jgi:hypothetical protein